MLANLLHNLNELNSWPTVIYYFTSIEKFKNRHFCCKKTEGVYILSVPFTKDNFFINKKNSVIKPSQDLPFHRNAHLPRPTPNNPQPQPDFQIRDRDRTVHPDLQSSFPLN